MDMDIKRRPQLSPKVAKEDGSKLWQPAALHKPHTTIANLSSMRNVTRHGDGIFRTADASRQDSSGQQVEVEGLTKSRLVETKHRSKLVIVNKVTPWGAKRQSK